MNYTVQLFCSLCTILLCSHLFRRAVSGVRLYSVCVDVRFFIIFMYCFVSLLHQYYTISFACSSNTVEILGCSWCWCRFAVYFYRMVFVVIALVAFAFVHYLLVVSFISTAWPCRRFSFHIHRAQHSDRTFGNMQ